MHLARRRGLTFSPVDMIGLHERYYNLELIRQGHNRHAWNVVYGSTDVGLLAMFRYSYDLGFGVQQSSRHSWIVVLERSKAPPEASTTPSDANSTPRATFAQAGPFTLNADLADTGLFGQPAARAVLLEFSRDWQVEICGNLLAVAAPWDESPNLTERLLSGVDQLARVLVA